MPFRPIQNASFYTDSPARCRQWVEEFTSAGAQIESPAPLVAGIVPHAGWLFSGAVAGRVWRTLAEHADPDTVVIFGAVHYPGVDENAAYPSGSWETPLGDVEIDGELAGRIVELAPGCVILDPHAHDREHSIEVNVPFVRALFPRARLLPIAAPPRRDNVDLGAVLAEAAADRSIIAVGSTDLTHYGERYMFAPAGVGPRAREWMRENDARMLELMAELRAEDAVPEAASHHNACGPGAIAATLAFARARGAPRGTVVDYRTSHDVSREPVFELAVGYPGLVF